jgi:hypothetical protein
MEPKDRYYTMGEYVHNCEPFYINLSVEQADIIRSDAIQIAADKGVDVRFKRRNKSGPRNGKSTVKLPKWVWEKAFENQKSKT